MKHKWEWMNRNEYVNLKGFKCLPSVKNYDTILEVKWVYLHGEYLILTLVKLICKCLLQLNDIKNAVKWYMFCYKKEQLRVKFIRNYEEKTRKRILF